MPDATPRGPEGAAVPHVVILGGGFGGLAAARALRKAPVRVTLVDRSNHHLFQPLLYQVATAALSPAHIAVALRRVLRRQKNAQVVMAEAVRIDAAQKRIQLKDGSLDYDFLVLATGATHSYFGHAEWSRFAPGLKSLEDAIEIRRRVLLAYEAAEREPDPAKRTALLTFVVVGAGPTGVELAGALAEIARHVLTRDFRLIDPSSARVVLVEAGPRVLPAFAPELSKAATLRLERMGVQVLLGRPVTAIDSGGVSMGGERILSRCVLWAAGVQASPIAASLGVPLDRAGRAVVQPCARATTSSSSEISPRCRASRASRRPRSRVAATPRAASCVSCKASRPSRFATSTRAPSRPSGATPPWRRSGRSSSKASSPG